MALHLLRHARKCGELKELVHSYVPVLYGSFICASPLRFLQIVYMSACSLAVGVCMCVSKGISLLRQRKEDFSTLYATSQRKLSTLYAAHNKEISISMKLIPMKIATQTLTPTNHSKILANKTLDPTEHQQKHS